MLQFKLVMRDNERRSITRGPLNFTMLNYTPPPVKVAIQINFTAVFGPVKFNGPVMITLVRMTKSTPVNIIAVNIFSLYIFLKIV